MTGIELDGLTVTYGDVAAVDDVDLRIRDGELFVLVGPSGCGKSTLLRTIAGLERASSGDVIVDGQRVTELPARKRDVSLVFQDFALFPHLDVRENLSFNLRMQGADDVRARTEEVADMLEIRHLLDRPVDELSGGQKQRVALGRSLATEPAAFLLDEPLANLDAALRDRTRTEIARLQEDLGITTVHVTHDQAEALSMGDRIGVMRDGRIVQVGAPETVYHSPNSRFVAAFIGSPSMNFLRGRYDSADGELVLSAETDYSLPLAFDSDIDEVAVGVRPEHVVVTPERPEGDTWIRARVEFEEFRGADRIAFLTVPEFPDLTVRVPGDVRIGSGDSLWLHVPPENVHCFDPETGHRLDAEANHDTDGSIVQRGDRR